MKLIIDFDRHYFDRFCLTLGKGVSAITEDEADSGHQSWENLVMKGLHEKISHFMLQQELPEKIETKVTLANA